MEFIQKTLLILYVKPFWFGFWPSLLAVILTLVIDRMRLPNLKVYAKKEDVVNTYPPTHPRAGETWKFVYFTVLNKKMPFLLRWLPRQTAVNCNAILEFIGNNSFKMRGRWVNSPQIPHVAPDSYRERVFFPDPISIFAGESESLDCIVQKSNEAEAYAWNNEAYLNNWRTPKYKLEAGKYKVKVKIIPQNGAPIKKTFTLNIDKNFELTSLYIEDKINRLKERFNMKKISIVFGIVCTIIGVILGIWANTDSARIASKNIFFSDYKYAINKFLYPNKYDKNIQKQQAKGWHEYFKPGLDVTFNYLDKNINDDKPAFNAMKEFIKLHHYGGKKINYKIRTLALAPFEHLGEDCANPDLNFVGIYVVEETDQNRSLNFKENCTEIMKSAHLVTTQNALMPRLDDLFSRGIAIIATGFLLFGCIISLWATWCSSCR